MKRTIKEVYNLIKEKRYTAENIHSFAEEEYSEGKWQGEMEAYQDVLCLIESSHLLEEDKPIKGSGLEALTIELENYEERGILYKSFVEPLLDLLKPVENALKALEIIKNVVRKDSILNHLNDWLKIGAITKEQYDLLKEVLL